MAGKARRLIGGERLWIGAATAAAAVVAWQVAGSHLGGTDQYIGTPLGALAAGARMLTDHEIAANAPVTITEFVVGLLLALVAGIPLGVLLGRVRKARAALEPLMMALYATPLLAAMPVLDNWLGVSGGATVAVVFLLAIIPIVLNTMTGIREVDPVWLRVAQSFGATERDLFFKIILPGALPAEMTGIRLAVGRGVLGAIVGEMYAAEAGLGQLTMQYGQATRTNHLMFLILLVSLGGYGLTAAARALERHVGRWRRMSLV